MHTAYIITADLKECWSYVCKKKVIVANLGLLENGGHPNKEIEMVEMLREHFASVCTAENSVGVEEAFSAQSNVVPLDNCDSPKDATVKVVHKAKLTKTFRPDRLAPQVVKADYD